jgi:tRNA A-37 threonylcarbamoyl transferase component Bud32
MDSHVLDAAGHAVARLHREGVLHGDLNAGNILFGPDGDALFLDLRHSRVLDGGLPTQARQRNVLRLCRSLHKLHAIHDRRWPERPGEILAAGYALGWGSTEAWLDDIVLAMDRGFPWRRRLFWSR